jgi:GalNAc-alpha-(1->4)-GalNAc-alpha-(1->3)-diNAcBac-PP-undecaprenol alpha-1,4-N-acetyl-D-galactosaminyltransferase
MRITIIIASLFGGGAERAALLLAEGLNARGYQVSFITIFPDSRDFYQISPQVTRISLGIDGRSPNAIAAIFNNIYRLGIIRQTISSLQPDVIISFLYQTNVLTLLASLGSKCPIIVCEQNNPQSSQIHPIWNRLRTWIYPLANKVVSTSKGVDAYFSWLSPAKRKVIYNPLAVELQNLQEALIPAGLNPETKWLIAMGRLTEQKGFDILLQAFARIAAQYPDWQLAILGEGELRVELEQLQQELGLQARVVMPGLIPNPFPLMQMPQAQLFVLSSRYEGFGNVIIEAMACELPVIATNCPSGPSEIISHDVNGLLVPNKDIIALAKAIEELICDEQKRKFLANNASKVIERFSVEKIIKMWEELFDRVT